MTTDDYYTFFCLLGLLDDVRNFWLRVNHSIIESIAWLDARRCVILDCKCVNLVRGLTLHIWVEREKMGKALGLDFNDHGAKKYGAETAIANAGFADSGD